MTINQKNYQTAPFIYDGIVEPFIIDKEKNSHKGKELQLPSPNIYELEYDEKAPEPVKERENTVIIIPL